MHDDEIAGKTEWWKDKEFMRELDTRYKAWEAGKEEGGTSEEGDALSETAGQKRNKK